MRIVNKGTGYEFRGREYEILDVFSGVELFFIVKSYIPCLSSIRLLSIRLYSAFTYSSTLNSPTLKHKIKPSF